MKVNARPPLPRHDFGGDRVKPADMSFDARLRSATDGDERAFATLWREFNPSLLRYLVALAGASDAEDLAAVTWIDALRSLPTFSGDEGNFKAWLFTIARHKMLDLRRRQTRRPVTGDDFPDHLAGRMGDPEAMADLASSSTEALALLGTLPPAQAEVILLRVLVGFSVAEVAEIVDRQAAAVRLLTHRGLRALARALAQPDAVRTAPRERRPAGSPAVMLRQERATRSASPG